MALRPTVPINSVSRFAALADPTRRAILARLMGGGLRWTALARAVSMSLPAVSKHLKVAGAQPLITARAGGRSGGLRLKAKPLKGSR